MRTGYFDNDGNCLVIQTGLIGPPEGASFAAPVPDDATPNTIEFEKGQKKVKAKKHPRPEPEQREPKTPLREEIEMLKVRLAVLEGMLVP